MIKNRHDAIKSAVNVIRPMTGIFAKPVKEKDVPPLKSPEPHLHMDHHPSMEGSPHTQTLPLCPTLPPNTVYLAEDRVVLHTMAAALCLVQDQSLHITAGVRCLMQEEGPCLRITVGVLSLLQEGLCLLTMLAAAFPVVVRQFLHITPVPQEGPSLLTTAEGLFPVPAGLSLLTTLEGLFPALVGPPHLTTAEELFLAVTHMVQVIPKLK